MPSPPLEHWSFKAACRALKKAPGSRVSPCPRAPRAAPLARRLTLPPAARPQAEKPETLDFQGNASLAAPAVADGADSGLPEGNQWRYSEFVNAVQAGKVERVRFAKDGTQLQLTAVDGAPPVTRSGSQ